MSRDEGEWQPRKPEWVVSLRRFKRRLKAAASVGLALAAGTFLALQGDALARDASVPPQDGGKSKGGSTPDKAKDKDKDKVADKDRDKKKDKDKGKVDKEEHRKGMPVRDNLLE